MARFICWILMRTSPNQLRFSLVILLVAECLLLSGIFALSGSSGGALYALAAGLVVLFVGTWRIRLFYSN